MPIAPTASSSPSAIQDRKLLLSALFTWLVVGALGVRALPPAPGPRLAVVGLFVAFGLLFLAVAWRRPMLPVGLSLALQALSIVGMAALSRQTMPFVILFFILSAEAALLYRGRALVAWLVGFFVLTFAVEWYAAGTPTVVWDALLSAAGYGFFAAFATVMRQVEAARAETQRLLEQIDAAHRQLQHYMQQAEELAAERERNRLARQLHSSLGHRLGLAEMHMQSLQRWLPPEAEQDFALALEQIQEALRDVQRVVAAQEETVENLVAAVRKVAHEFTQATGIPVEVEIAPHLNALPRGLRLLLYSAVQEGLSNIRRHAHASWAALSLRADDRRVTLMLEDDGVGPPNEAVWQEQGLGLRGLAERLARWNGTLRLERRKPQGARLVITLTRPEEPMSLPRA